MENKAQLLPKEKTIGNLIASWDKLGLSWNFSDVLGCIVPNEPGGRNHLLHVQSLDFS